MKLIATLGCAGLLAAASTSQATIVGFGQLGGNNTQVPVSLASNATADAAGYTVSNGTTPNIALSWDVNWDIHTSTQFGLLEGKTVGGTWDNEGVPTVPRVGQLDNPTHTVGITAAAGSAVVLNSFDFGMTSETTGTSTWSVTLTNTATSAVVYSTTVNFNTVGQAANQGDVQTITPNFTGALGTGYTLTFNRTANSYDTNGRLGIDNLSFNQTAVPEPASLSLLGLGAAALLRRRNAR